MAKKSYNPFKMWGSYVGAGIVFIYTLFAHSDFFGCSGTGYKLLTQNFSDCVMSFFGILWIVYIIIGFLLGWGIHSLVRKLK